MATPLKVNHKLSKDEGEPLEDSIYAATKEATHGCTERHLEMSFYYPCLSYRNLNKGFLTQHAHADARGKHFKYLPFGSGHRICLGITMALQIVHLVVACLLHGFDLRTRGDELVDMTEGIGLSVPKLYRQNARTEGQGRGRGRAKVSWIIGVHSSHPQQAMDYTSLQIQLPAIAAAGLVALIFLYNLFRVARKKGKSEDQPPEPPGAWPIIGHFRETGGNVPMHRKFGALADKYGPAFGLRFGSLRFLVVSSWEMSKECFTTNDKALAGRPRSEAGIIMGYDNATLTLSPHDSYWRSLKKLTSIELLSPQRLESLKHIRLTEVGVMMKHLFGLWEKNERKAVNVDVREKFGDITFNVIAMMVIGKRCFTGLGDESEEMREFRHIIHEGFVLLGAFVPSDAFPWLRWFDVKGYMKKMWRLYKVGDSLLSRWLEEHRVRKQRGGSDQDFMDFLISTVHGSDLKKFDTDTIIKASVSTAIFGAYDTSWITNTWTLSLLLNHRDKLRRVQEEMDEHVGRDRNVDESDIPKLAYLQAVVKESMRLYPPAPMSGPHQAVEDCYVGGYRIRAGTVLLVNLWKMHRDPRIWSDPEKFLPERFLTQHAHVDGRGSHFEYLPFGSGRRMCPGITMALQIVHLTLARLLHGFDLRTPGDVPVDMTEGTGMTVQKETPLQVVLSPRLPLHLYK
ncbi:hypothetical protein ACLOJK_038633 [Asimina triloba]